MNSPHNQVAPLAGIRVLELGNYIAAPTAGRLLADFGADVIKVERPRTGDELRTWRLHSGTTSLLYRTINRNKRSVVLDLKTELGRKAVLDLVPHCDVVIENFRPGALERWGIGPEELNRARPDIVIVRVSAFGQTGPWSRRPGFAAVAEAHGGFRELVGEEDRPPVRVGVSIGDSIAGLYAAFGSLMALLDRSRRQSTDRPPAPLVERVIDVALNESVLSMMESLIPDFDAYGGLRQRTGGRMEGIAPSNAYPCKDGANVVIAGNGDGIFRRLMRLMGRHDLAIDPSFADNAQRWGRRDELDEVITFWTSSRSSEDVLEALEQAEVPSGRINTAEDLLADAQLAARGMIQRFDVDDGGKTMTGVGFPGIVPVIGERSIPVRCLGPDLGVHTREVLTQLAGWEPKAVDGLTDAEEVAS